MMDLLFPDGQSNTAGVYLLRFGLLATISSMPYPSGGSVTGSISFQDGSRWYNVYGSDYSKTYDEERQLTDNGPVYTVTVGCFFPGDSAAVRSQLDWMGFHRFLLECEDNEGLLRRIGSPQEGLTFAYTYSSGNQPGDRRGYTLKWTGQFSAIPPVVS